MESIKLTRERFLSIEKDLLAESDNLRQKRELLDSRESNEMVTIWMMDNWNAAESLRRKEKDLIYYRKERTKVEIKVVRLYQKALSLTMSKVSAFLGRLASPEFEDVNMVCPADFTVQAYREWLKHDPKLLNIHSEILELLTQKVKLASEVLLKEEKVDIPRSFTNDSDKNGPMDFEKLRKRAYTMIRTAPHLDSSFSEFVSELISPTSDSFEGRKTTEYIHECWRYFEDKNNDNTSNGVIDEASPCSPVNYQMFLCALTQFIVDRYSQLSSFVMASGVNPSDIIHKIVEANLFPQICDCVYRSISFKSEDELIVLKYDAIGNVTQKTLGIKPEHIKDEPFAYGRAISMLKSTTLAKTPNQRLRRVILAAQYVMDEMNKTCKEYGIVAGADEFMDIWIYVILKAKLPDLSTMVALLKNYCNPSIMLSEAGYYISSLEFACEYVKSVEKADLPHSSTFADDDTNTHSVKYVMLDIERVIQLSKNCSCPFEVIDEEVMLHGYETITVIDWFNDSFRVLKKLAVANPRVSTHACIIQPKFGLFKGIRNFENFLCTYLKGPKIVHFEDSDIGRVPTINKDLCPYEMLLIKVPHCSLKSMERKLQYLCNIRGLGITVSTIPKNDSPGKAADASYQVLFDVVDYSQVDALCSQMEQLFAKNFHMNENSALTFEIYKIVSDIQHMLQKLGFLSTLMKVTGLYDTYLSKAVSEFQRSYNCNHQSASVLLSENGRCDYATYCSMRNSTEQLSMQCIASV